MVLRLRCLTVSMRFKKVGGGATVQVPDQVQMAEGVRKTVCRKCVELNSLFVNMLLRKIVGLSR